MKVEEQYQNEKRNREETEKKKLKDSEQQRLEKERAWKEVSDKLEHQQKVQNEMAKFSTPSKSETKETATPSSQSNQPQQQENSKSSSSDTSFEDIRRPTNLPDVYGTAFKKLPFVDSFMEEYKKRNGFVTLPKNGNEKIPYFQQKFGQLTQQNQIQQTK